MRADNRKCNKSWNLGDLGVGRESFTVQNVHESVLWVGLSIWYEFSVVAD